MKYSKALWNISTCLLALMCAYILVSVSLVHFKAFNNNAYAHVLVSLPQAQLINHNQKVSMSPFIFVGGGKFNKVGFPALPDSDTQLNVEEDTPISFEFSQKPLKVQAFIVDYDGDIPSVLPLKKTGSNSFEIPSFPGIWDIEVHATFPGGQYSSFTTLVNVMGTLHSLSINSNGQQTACSNPTNLQIQGVTDNNNNINNVNSLAIARSFNSDNSSINPNPIEWSAKGKGSWIQFDLGKEKSICKLLVGFANGDKVINFFSIQASTDGTHFVNEGTVQNTGMISGGELFNIPDSPIQARYIKIAFQSNGQGEISNIKVMGTDNVPYGAYGGNGGVGGISEIGGVGGISENGTNANGASANGASANGASANGTNGTNANGVNGTNANGTNGGIGGVGGIGENGANANGVNGSNANGTNGGIGGVGGIGENGANANGANGGIGGIGGIGGVGGIGENGTNANGASTNEGTTASNGVNGANANGANEGVGGIGGIGSNANGANEANCSYQSSNADGGNGSNAGGANCSYQSSNADGGNGTNPNGANSVNGSNANGANGANAGSNVNGW
ncbi:MAG: discoidin domain-containing protein [Candidatus Nitrosopolaris sp.]